MIWRTARLGDIADVNWGDTSVTKSSYVAQGYSAYSAAGPDGFLPYADYDRPAIVLSAIGARCGKTWFASGKWSCIKNTIRFWSTSDLLDDRFLYWITNDEDFFPKRGAAQPFIAVGDAREATIPMPPLHEQRRIATMLDKADTLRRKRKRAIEMLDSLTQAIFQEMFGDPLTNPQGWKQKPLSAYERFITSGSRGWAKYYTDSGRGFIRIQNLVDGELSTDDLIYVNAPDNAEARRTTVQQGDVLISITADLGRTAVVPPSLHNLAHINQHVALIRTRDIDPAYLSMYLASSAGRAQFEALNRQGVKAGLNFDNIRELQILEPPLELQKEFVAKKRSVSSVIDRLVLQADSMKDLFSSLQHRAFSGQL